MTAVGMPDPTNTGRPNEMRGSMTITVGSSGARLRVKG
jgi:hypothetical protein